MSEDFLSEAEYALAQEFLNPDDEQEVKFGWDYDYQQHLLGMLLADRQFLIQSLNLIKPGYFVRKSHEKICEVVFKFFDKYKEMPSRQFIAAEIKEAMRTSGKLGEYLGELNIITQSYEPGLAPREYLLDKLTEFAKEQSLREGFSQALDILQKNVPDKWPKISEVLKKALLTDRKFDPGLDYFGTLDERYDRMSRQKENREVFSCIFPSINEALSYGGLCRGEIAAIMGMPGTGKSVFLVKAAVVNILSMGKKVAYISTEMDPDKIARRFDAQMAFDIPIWKLEERRAEVIHNIRTNVDEYDDKRRLVIKQFPAGTADVNTVRAYMTQMKLQGFVPDLLVVDYVGEFKDIEGVKTYESRQRMVRDLRGLAVEENVCVLTALQPDRGGRAAQEQGHIDDHNLADSFGQSRPLDALWTINQTEREKSAKIGRVFVAKHRDGKSRFHFYYKQNPETLDVEEISEDIWKELLNNVVEQKSNNVAVGEFHVKAKKKQKDN